MCATSVARTLIDLAEELTRDQLRDAFAAALPRGLLEMEAVRRSRISAVTLSGLHHGVLVATEAERAGRLATLVSVERNFAALPVDADVAPHYGRLMADSRRRRAKLRTADALIAATAAAHRLPLITRNRDFARLSGVVTVIV